MSIIPLNINDFDNVWKLFCESFQDDAYYRNLVEFNGFHSLYELDDTFSPAIKYCLQEKGFSYGVYQDKKLIAFILALDFQKLCQNKAMYDCIFGTDSSDKNDTEKETLQQKLSVIKNGKKKTVYCMSIAVQENHRRKGVASLLIDQIIEYHPDYEVVTDVSNKNSLKIYRARGFIIENMGDDYFFVHKMSI